MHLRVSVVICGILVIVCLRSLLIKRTSNSLIKKLDLILSKNTLGTATLKEHFFYSLPAVRRLIKPLAFFNIVHSTYISIKNKDILGICLNISIIYSTYISIINQNPFEIYLSGFLFLIGVLIKLIQITEIWVKNNQLKQEFPMFHSIIKYILWGLLSINLLILVIIGQKLLIMAITYLKKLFLNKLRDLKLSLDYKKVQNNEPRKPEVKFFSDLKNKKKNKKKASSLKEKIFNLQKKNLKEKGAEHTISSRDTTFNQTSFSERRGWNHTINLGNNPKFTRNDQLNNVRSEFQAYDNQEKKFKKIVVDINKEKENFFPNESTSLFKDYITVIKILKKNLKSVEKNIKKIPKN